LEGSCSWASGPTWQLAAPRTFGAGRQAQCGLKSALRDGAPLPEGPPSSVLFWREYTVGVKFVAPLGRDHRAPLRTPRRRSGGGSSSLNPHPRLVERPKFPVKWLVDSHSSVQRRWDGVRDRKTKGLPEPQRERRLNRKKERTKEGPAEWLRIHHATVVLNKDFSHGNADHACSRI
jgi:hypothetical protein